MPSEEIRAVLSAEDPEIVRRYLELHRERLEEQADEQRRTLDSLERSLTEAIRRRELDPAAVSVQPAKNSSRTGARASGAAPCV